MATMQDVANLAGVSLSTVSYTLTGKRPVSAATRTRVEAAMTQLGFRRHAVARALASRRSHVLAVAYPTYGVSLGTTLNQIVAGAAAAAHDADYALVLWPVSSSEPETLRELAAHRGADAVLLMEVTLDDPRIEAVEEAGLVCGLIGRTAQPQGRVWVDADFEDALAQAVDHLVGLGHRHIAFVNRDEASLAQHYGPSVRALAGYEAAMARHGLHPISAPSELTPFGGHVVARRLLAQYPELTAFVVMNELALFGVSATLREQGLVVPRDMSLVAVAIAGEISEMFEQPLTHVAMPGPELGYRAVRDLLVALDGDVVPPGDLLPCVLEPRATSGPARTP